MKAEIYTNDLVQISKKQISLKVTRFEEWREKLVEAVAETDEALMERYLEGEEISEAELKAAIRKATC